MKNYKEIWLKEIKKHLKKWKLRTNLIIGGINNE